MNALQFYHPNYIVSPYREQLCISYITYTFVTYCQSLFQVCCKY